jgi:hypothetical protein
MKRRKEVRKIISILLALSLVLIGIGAAAVPVAAVEAPISVDVSEPIAGALADYTIEFHNVGLLAPGDWIDVMFPFGTDLTTATTVTVTKAASQAKLDTAPVVVTVFAAISMPAPTGELVPRTMRIIIDDFIDKCEWVRIVIEDVTNPESCNHVLEVGTSSHTPVDSEPYTIYSLKMCLDKGKNLVSLPAYPADTKIEVVLADLFTEAAKTASATTPFTFSVWYWDAAAKKWLKYASDSSFKDLKTLEAGKAYWIKVNYDICFYFKGDPYPEDQGPPVKFCQFVECWNMVGIASSTDILASVYLKNTLLAPFYTQYAVDAIYDWDEATQTYVDMGWTGQYPAVVDPLLEAGQGYWMSFRDAACIIPPLP